MLGDNLLGLYEKAFPDELCWEEKIDIASHLGFDFIEISIDESDSRLARLQWSCEEKREFEKQISRSNLQPQSLCLSAHRRFPFGSANSQVREMARKIMEQAFSFAVDLQIPIIQLAGYDVYYEPSTIQSNRAFIDAIRWACDLANEYQVKLAIETMDTEYLNSVEKYLTISRELESPWLYVYADVGNLSAWPENDVLRELELGGKEIAQIHLKETIKNEEHTEGTFREVPFGQGCVDFPAIFQCLDAIGYAEPFTIEMWHDDKQDMYDQIVAAKNYIDAQYAIGMQ